MDTGGVAVAVDVGYHAQDRPLAVAAVAEDWSFSSYRLVSAGLDEPAPAYRPGRMYLRELPAILAALERADQPPSLVVVDGYATLDPSGHPGPGAVLSERLGGTPVIGVAKNAFRSATHAVEV